jgi:hypothetical protein
VSSERLINESPIVVRELHDEGLRLPMWGRFDGVELVYCLGILPDGRARTWTREPRESAEIFSARIVRDVVEAVRGMCVDVLVA